jgi:hypothetical protein
MNAGEAQLSRGIQTWCSAQQQDLAVTAQKHVGIDDAGMTMSHRDLRWIGEGN